MVATGTGIAPYRGFIRRLFEEETPAREAYAGEVRRSEERNDESFIVLYLYHFHHFHH